MPLKAKTLPAGKRRPKGTSRFARLHHCRIEWIRSQPATSNLRYGFVISDQLEKPITAEEWKCGAFPFYHQRAQSSAGSRIRKARAIRSTDRTSRDSREEGDAQGTLAKEAADLSGSLPARCYVRSLTEKPTRFDVQALNPLSRVHTCCCAGESSASLWVKNGHWACSPRGELSHPWQTNLISHGLYLKPYASCAIESQKKEEEKRVFVELEPAGTISKGQLDHRQWIRHLLASMYRLEWNLARKDGFVVEGNEIWTLDMNTLIQRKKPGL